MANLSEEIIEIGGGIEKRRGRSSKGSLLYPLWVVFNFNGVKGVKGGLFL